MGQEVLVSLKLVRSLHDGCVKEQSPPLGKRVGKQFYDTLTSLNEAVAMEAKAWVREQVASPGAEVGLIGRKRVKARRK